MVKKKELTEILLIVDRSGSMDSVTNDTIGGVNAFIESQKKLKGEARLTLCLFNSVSKLIYDGVDIQAVNKITQKEYYALGGTALYDAVGESIESIQGKTPKAKKHIVVIVTDGEENSSRNYSKEKVSKIIKEKEEDGWSFVYLSANADAFLNATSLGINVNKQSNLTRNYNNNPLEVKGLYCAISETVADVRDGKIEINDNKGKK